VKADRRNDAPGAETDANLKVARDRVKEKERSRKDRDGEHVPKMEAQEKIVKDRESANTSLTYSSASPQGLKFVLLCFP
jgi:hypothetical protein